MSFDLQELRKSTLRSYRDKASEDARQKRASLSNFKKLEGLSTKRADTLDKTPVKNYADRVNRVASRISRKDAEGYKSGAEKLARKVTKRERGIAAADKRLNKEETSPMKTFTDFYEEYAELSELDRKTLVSYMSKAVQDRSQATVKKPFDTDKKAEKRNRGIAVASRKVRASYRKPKVSMEEYEGPTEDELQEVSTRTLKNYKAKATMDAVRSGHNLDRINRAATRRYGHEGIDSEEIQTGKPNKYRDQHDKNLNRLVKRDKGIKTADRKLARRGIKSKEADRAFPKALDGRSPG